MVFSHPPSFEGGERVVIADEGGGSLIISSTYTAPRCFSSVTTLYSFLREAGVHESVTDGEARDWPSPRGKKDGESGGAVVGAAVAGRSGADAVEDVPLLPRRRPEGSERRDRRDEEHHRGAGDDVSGGFRRLRRRPEAAEMTGVDAYQLRWLRDFLVGAERRKKRDVLAAASRTGSLDRLYRRRLSRARK